MENILKYTNHINIQHLVYCTIIVIKIILIINIKIMDIILDIILLWICIVWYVEKINFLNLLSNYYENWITCFKIMSIRRPRILKPYTGLFSIRNTTVIDSA